MIVYMVVWAFILFHLKAKECDEDSSKQNRNDCWNEAVKTHWLVLTLVIYSIIFSFFVFLLCGYHHYLMILNNTTNEHIKGTYKLLGNPFKANYKKHFSLVFENKTLRRFWDNNKIAKSEEEAEHDFNKSNTHYFFIKWGLVDELICEEFRNKTSTRETRKGREEVVEFGRGFGIGKE